MTELLSNLLTNSRLKTARQCARLHLFIYVLGYRPVADKAELAFGTLIHKALEAWWLAVKAQLPDAEWFLKAVAALDAVPDVDAFDLAKAKVMIAGYHARWAADALLYEVLGVEERFEFALVNPDTGRPSPIWRIGGKLDVRVLRKSDSTVGFIEHKTSGEDVSLGSAYWQMLRMDSQVSTYFDGAHSLGPQAEWCLYDVLGKPTQRPKDVPVVDEHGSKIVVDAKGERVRARGGKWRQTADTEQGFVLLTRPETADEYGVRCFEAVSEAPDRFFTRGAVVRLEKELDEARAEIWQQAANLRESINAGRHPRNTDSCRRGNALCLFFPVCSGAAALDDLRLYTRGDFVHPELAEVISASAR